MYCITARCKNVILIVIKITSSKKLQRHCNYAKFDFIYNIYNLFYFIKNNNLTEFLDKKEYINLDHFIRAIIKLVSVDQLM